MPLTIFGHLIEILKSSKDQTGILTTLALRIHKTLFICVFDWLDIIHALSILVKTLIVIQKVCTLRVQMLSYIGSNIEMQ